MRLEPRIFLVMLKGEKEMRKRVLIIAFDGLDRELIENYDCERIKQREFGKISLGGFKRINTPQVFASFITGKTEAEHGINKIGEYPDSIKGGLIKYLPPDFILKNLKGGFFLRITFERLLSIDRELPGKSDLEAESFFEKINHSEAICVPAYNPSSMYRIWRKVSRIEDRKKLTDVEFIQRRIKLYRVIKEEKELVMCHFHKPDAYHHLFWEIGRKKKVKEMYEEMDKFAEEIKNRAQGKYDYIIFMSDHGLPSGQEHNKNAFYSCNKELFPDKTPHITDFHDKILEIRGKKKEIGGVEV